MLSLFTTQSPYQTYAENVKREQVEGFVRELEGTGVDALMLCPQAWRTNLWRSEVDRRWQDEAPNQVEPLPEAERTYFDKAYWRIRRYMLQGEDPVAISVQTAKEIGLDVLFSYRMNDHHETMYRDCPTHSSFWRNHPEYWLEPSGAGTLLNYLIPQVRDWYFSLIEELLHKFDVEGFEFDFQRYPMFFPEGKQDEGRAVMTAFVERVRRLLDEVSSQRGKPLQLGARVPHTLDRCREIGLDLPEWSRKGLIDMVNASPYFVHTPKVDIEGFKRELSVPVYGELHPMSMLKGQTASGYSNNIRRRTTPIQYETVAHSFLERGADGISFFNFAYAREHSFNEPRRKEFPGVEPPFSVIRSICDKEYLATRPKHYSLVESYGGLPQTIGLLQDAHFMLHVAVNANASNGFVDAVLRLETTTACWREQLHVDFNGARLEPLNRVGELFPPFTLELLPPYEQTRCFAVPLARVRYGENHIRVFQAPDHKQSAITLRGVELALYTHGKSK